MRGISGCTVGEFNKEWNMGLGPVDIARMQKFAVFEEFFAV